ncbi:MAG: hypothetical protein D8H92_12500 [Campylobacter sp.]|nr:MAG: hypothetical protein D8H92_12500 [Campylobacter sp.]
MPSQNFKISKTFKFYFYRAKNFVEFANRAGAENNASRLRAVSSPEIARLSSHRKSSRADRRCNRAMRRARNTYRASRADGRCSRANPPSAQCAA